MDRKYVAVIQAGGKGTRMLPLTKDEIPKPMLLLNGRPMLEWQIENISEYGIKEFVIITGHLGEKIKEYFGDGFDQGIQIRYIEEKEPLGSAGALYYLNDRYTGCDFLLVFGDIMFCLDFERMFQFHESHHSKATLLAHPNAHPYDSDLLILSEDGEVTGIDPKGNQRDYWYSNCVNAGIYILGAEFVGNIKAPVKADLEKDVIMPEIGNGAIFGYVTTEYVKDAGTPERFAAVALEQKKGVWFQKCLKQKQKCIFLDRDGTVNRYDGLIFCEGQLELEKNAAEAIKKINQSGYLAIIVTNQPVVARGMCSLQDVGYIHKKLQVLLGKQGAYLDDIAFCPHHPDKGYPEEDPLYKIACGCRKPGIGLIRKMADQHNIDLRESYFVGDSTIDIMTGKNAGLKTILVKTGQAGTDGKYDVRADYEAEDILEAVSKIIDQT